MPPVTGADFPREAFLVQLSNEARPTIWIQVEAHLAKHGDIGNAEVRALLLTDDPVRASRSLKFWLDLGLLVVANPEKSKQFRRYRRPASSPAETLFSRDKVQQVCREPEANWSDEATPLHAEWWKARIARQAEIDKSIAAKAEFEYLYDKPCEDKKKVRVAGPFTVESLSPHRMLGVDENDELIDEAKENSPEYGAKHGTVAEVLDHWPHLAAADGFRYTASLTSRLHAVRHVRNRVAHYVPETPRTPICSRSATSRSCSSPSSPHSQLRDPDRSPA